jgi:dTDP-glucose 4,6-dehydratase
MCKTVIADITNRDLIEDLIKKHNFTTVFHFAAQSHVDNSFEDPVSFTINNALGTHILIDSFRVHNPNVEFIHFSTDEVYGENNTTTGFTEETILNPTNPYAASKAAAEMTVQSYIKSFNMNIKIIRCNNVYGPNQYPEKLIPKFINILKSGGKCTIHGDGLVKRSFIHVDDVCSAVILVWKKAAKSEVYNISSDYEYSVIDITKLLIKTIKGHERYEECIEHVNDRPFNDKSYLNDCTKLKKLGWVQNKNSESLIEFILSNI